MGAVKYLQDLLAPLWCRAGIGAVPPSLKHLDYYIAAAKKRGLDRPYLFLSFDCDTDHDAVVVGEIHSFLDSLGIKATYAVPGTQLLKTPDVYRRLAERGAEFMNHGGLPHAEWRDDRWTGITFYDAMAPEAVELDIKRGHDIVTSVIGRAPLGFRAPHFGCFQKAEQVALLHRAAAILGYKYCSTTLPSFGLRFGPAFESLGLIEFPCFGSLRNPETILDSWTYLIDKKNYTLDANYYVLMVETVQLLLSRRLPSVLTWYADPSHVHNQRPFMAAMKYLARQGIKSVSGAELATLVSQ